MLQRTAVLRSESGKSIYVSVRPRDGTYLLECLEPSEFLRHVTAGRLDPDLPPDAFLRGYVTVRREAFIQLFDSLGSLCPEVELNEAETSTLVRSIC